MSFTNEGAKRVSPFTDEHLKRLKEHMKDPRYADLLNLKGLLARLEASEALNAYAGHKDFCGIGEITSYCQCRLPEAKKAWRRSCGEGMKQS